MELRRGAQAASNASLTKNILRIVIHAVFLEERAKFLLEAEFAVLLLLAANLGRHAIQV
jgi:hypothetical protein